VTTVNNLGSCLLTRLTVCGIFWLMKEKPDLSQVAYMEDFHDNTFKQTMHHIKR